MFQQSRIFPVSSSGPRASARLAAMAAERSGARAAPSRPDDGQPDAGEPDAVEFVVERGGVESTPGTGPPRGAGRLVEHWMPGGTGTSARMASAVRRRPVIAVAGVGLAVAVVTMISMLSAQPQPEVAPRLPPATAAPAPGSVVRPVSTAVSSAPAKIIVSVVGRVSRPGLVTLPDGSRVADAVRAAGGAKAGTSVLALNLARRLADGEQIYVGIPVPPGASPAPAAAAAGAGGGGAASGTAAGAKIDLNTATAEQLDSLPGVGEVTAQNILDWRGQHGRFASVSQLNDVDGIGEVRYDRLKDLVDVR